MRKNKRGLGCFLVLVLLLVTLCALTGGLHPAHAEGETATPTPTISPTPAPLVVVTPTPAADAPVIRRTVEFLDGHQYTVERVITYGDAMVVIAVSVMVLLQIIYIAIYLVERWLP